MTEIRNAEADTARFRLRVGVVALVIVLAFGLLAWRLYVLQVQRHAELAERAETNRTAVVPIVPGRGEIFDRNGVVLATSYKAYTLEITPSRVEGKLADVIDAIDEVVPVSMRDRRRFERLRQDTRSFESLPIRTRLSDEEVARFAAQRYRFPGVEIKARLFRTYPLGETAGHVVGYIGRINQADKDRIEEAGPEMVANYRGTDYIGKLGIEASYEDVLHGATGVEQMETSAGGHAVRRLASRPATPGASVRLTIDINLQKLVEELYGQRRGALVAIEPHTGEILAFVSKPTYDPNLFVEGIDHESWAELNESIDRPLLNRALRGTYPPGSTYKPFMGLAGLESGKRLPGSITMDGGSWTLAGHTFRSGHALGPVNLERSIIKSSNVYYYQLAHDMGVNAIHDFMAPLGFGQLTGIDLPGEARGILPSTDWKRRTYKRAHQQKWLPGETISLGIGQGYNSFTMLQLAQATAILAAGGVKHPPHLVRARQDPMTGELHDVPQPPGQPMGYKPAHVALVQRGMVGVTQQGTSRGVFAGAPYLSAGKTGTAQAITIGQKSRYNAAKLAEHQRDHSLYIAFAPAENPRIAVAAIVENAGYGAAAAAPIVRRVFDYWLAGLYPSEQDLRAVQQGRASAPIGTPRAAADLAIQPPRATPP
ncbi:penicillin-binding protein 2 [Comamonadaceae bacterium OH2545_COT-014]|nr:penicillin-binding protein 2 [Comamonadaceae bacterium OH2545_COT-014]